VFGRYDVANSNGADPNQAANAISGLAFETTANSERPRVLDFSAQLFRAQLQVRNAAL